VKFNNIEKRKLELEQERIKIEWYRTWGTIASIAIPLILVVATNYYGTWLENERAKTNFQIKAMEIILNAQGGGPAGRNKAIVLQELFPDYMPKDLVKTMKRIFPDEHNPESIE